jgi:hypothetical protein
MGPGKPFSSEANRLASGEASMMIDIRVAHGAIHP